MGNIEDVEGVKSTDSMSDFSSPIEMQYPNECIENAEQIGLEELRETNPEVAEYVDRMTERLNPSHSESNDNVMNSFEYFREDDGSILIRSNSDEWQNSFMVVKGDDVYCEAGGKDSDHHLNEFINEVELMPNKVYHIDGHFNYETDDQGRVVKSSEFLSGVDELDRSGERGNLKPIANGKDGLSDDIGGHIVANNVYGPTESINIFPQNKDLNISGDWKEMENTVQKAVENGDKVIVTKNFEYSDTSKRPDSIKVTVDINDNITEYNFKNESPYAESVRDSLEGQEIQETVSESTREISEPEMLYIKEVIDDPENLVNRIDEFSTTVPPKAIDSDKSISDLIDPAKKDIPTMYLEAPSDSIQIEQISDAMKDTEGLNFNDWKNMSYEERCDALQVAEYKIGDIEHRPACDIKYETLEKGTYGYFNPMDKTITINSDYIKSDNFADYKETLDTLIHEGRHAYQDYNLTEREVHPRSGELANWKYNEHTVGYQDCQTCGFEAYALQPVESDARAFAEDVLKNYLNA